MILSLETSPEPASISLFNCKEQHFTRTLPNNNIGNEPLADELKHLLDQEASVKFIIVGAGPGSYSGAKSNVHASLRPDWRTCLDRQ